MSKTLLPARWYVNLGVEGKLRVFPEEYGGRLGLSYNPIHMHRLDSLRPLHGENNITNKTYVSAQNCIALTP